MQSKKFMFCASVCLFVSTISLTGQAADNQIDTTQVAADTSRLIQEIKEAKDTIQVTPETKDMAQTQEVKETKDMTPVAQDATAVKDTKPKKNKQSKKTKEKPKPAGKVPVVIEADNLSFSDSTGDFSADGHVSVVQDGDKIVTDFLRGNNKQTEFWIDGKADFFELGTKLTGTGTHYNYTDHTGSMKNAVGTVEKQYVSGKDLDLAVGKMVIYNGTLTSCPAIVPDYHMSARRVEIWPGDKMIAYDAKFWLGKMVIYSTPRYETSLKDGAGTQNAFPRLHYSSANGLGIMQKFEFPIGDHVAAYTDIAYDTRLGFKNQYGVIDREKTYSLNLMDGDYQDGNDNWIKKEPELNFSLYNHRLGKSPIQYTFSASYGKWIDATKESWHQDYNLYFTHDKINLSKSLSLNLGTGIERIKESYDDSLVDTFKFDSVLTKTWTPRFSTLAEYHYTENPSSLFNYNSTDMAQEGNVGFTYKIDKKNSVGVRERYDLTNHEEYDRYYIWYRDLHCWQATFSYRTRDSSIHWELSTTRW